MRKESASEAGLLRFDPPKQLKACWMQPGGDLPSLLAQSFGLTASGLTLSGVPGQRTVFAASGALRCTLGPDRSTLKLANSAELLDHWIVALAIELQRDWTWDGFPQPAPTMPPPALTMPPPALTMPPPALTIRRRMDLDQDESVIGTVLFPNTVGATALGDLQHPPDRTMTRLVFLDAISPQFGQDAFPVMLNPVYSVTAAFPEAPSLQQRWSTLRLPITTPPRQTPRIVSTGIAESPYLAAPDYSSAELRDRYLWIEFDAPIEDTTNDTYFGRVLAYGPDPLLARSLESLKGLAPNLEHEPQLPIDPEPVRLIFAG